METRQSAQYMKVILLFSVICAFVNALVEPINSLDEFYDVVNEFNASRPRYTVVKYYTNWCSHCKRLKPIFEQLSESSKLQNIEIVDPVLISDVEFRYLEVDCDKFAGMLCKRLEGFPMVEVIKPLRGPLAIDNLHEGVGWARSFWNKISQGGYDPKWKLDLDRVVTFEGSRNLDTLEGFLQKVVNIDQWDQVVDTVISGECSDGDALCAEGKSYISKVSDLSAELMNLEKMMRTRTEFSKDLFLKYLLVNKKIDSQKPIENDEL